MVIGRRARELREQAGKRQQDVADAARSLGLPWMPTRVAALERGSKAVGIEELVLLPVALSRSLGTTVTVHDLIEPDVAVRLSDGHYADGRSLLAALSGDPALDLIREDELSGSSWVGRQADSDPHAPRIASWLGMTQMDRGRALYTLRSFGEADQRAARHLGVSPLALAYLSHKLWGRSLTHERDRRLAEDLDLGAAEASSLAARRGRVSRTLLGEARTLLHEVDGEVPDGEHQEAP